MGYFVYLIESEKDRDFYVGQTNNLEKRLDKHNRGLVTSTKSRRPFRLVGFVELDSREEASVLERELKNHSDKKLKFIRKFKPEFSWRNKPL